MSSLQISRRGFLGGSAAVLASLALGGCSSNSTSSSTSSSTSTEKPTVRLGTTNDGHIFNAIATEQ